ncbi:MAG: class I SAM-dependent methyltransferase [Acidimicrobiia bacterium]
MEDLALSHQSGGDDRGALACRSCRTNGLRTFLDLGRTPLADALVDLNELDEPDETFPLVVAFCEECALVQLLGEVPPEKLFVDNYLYFSSFSDELLEHARRHAVDLAERRGLGERSLVVELASNDGYLLRNFVDRGIPVLGIDPAPAQAKAAEAAGVPTIPEFFDAEVARRLVSEGYRADVILANNVMAHVPDLNAFVAGMSILLRDDGVVTVENPYVRDLIENVEFDTIYHEHFSYFSCTAVDRLVRRHGMFLNHVDYFPRLHGGTLRWWIGKREEPSNEVRRYLEDEAALEMTAYGYYQGFADRVAVIKADLLELLHRLRDQGGRIAAYGAAAKGSTLLNYMGIGRDVIEFVVDRNVHKQGLAMPGVHIPIRDPQALLDEQPDYVLLLAWNFKDEIIRQQADYRRAGGRFIVPLPVPSVI